MRDRARRAGDDAKGPRRARFDDDDDDPDFSVGGGGGSRKNRSRNAPAVAKSGGGGGGGPSTSSGGGQHQQEYEQPDHMQIDPAALAAAAAAAGEAAGGVDPGLLSALVAAGGAQAIGIGPDGQPVALDISGAGLQQLDGLQGAGGLYTVDAIGAGALVQPLAPLANQFAAPDALASEGIKRGDFESVAAARRAGTLITVRYNLEMSEELADADVGEQQGSVEVPQSADVSQLKRLLWYKGMNILLPGCQVLISEDGREMEEADEGGLPLSISAYGVTDGSTITLRVVVPDDIDTIPLVDEAIVSAAYSAGKLVLHRGGGGGGSAASRKTRWTEEQIEALIDGVERHGLSAWKTIVQDPRLDGKNNMQCKDKFRNLCLTIIQGRPERGLTLDWTLKDRVRKLIDQESIQF